MKCNLAARCFLFTAWGRFSTAGPCFYIHQRVSALIVKMVGMQSKCSHCRQVRPHMSRKSLKTSSANAQNYENGKNTRLKSMTWLLKFGGNVFIQCQHIVLYMARLFTCFLSFLSWINSPEEESPPKRYRKAQSTEKKLKSIWIIYYKQNWVLGSLSCTTHARTPQRTTQTTRIGLREVLLMR